MKVGGGLGGREGRAVGGEQGMEEVIKRSKYIIDMYEMS